MPLWELFISHPLSSVDVLKKGASMVGARIEGEVTATRVVTPGMESAKRVFGHELVMPVHLQESLQWLRALLPSRSDLAGDEYPAELRDLAKTAWAELGESLRPLMLAMVEEFAQQFKLEQFGVPVIPLAVPIAVMLANDTADAKERRADISSQASRAMATLERHLQLLYIFMEARRAKLAAQLEAEQLAMAQTTSAVGARPTTAPSLRPILTHTEQRRARVQTELNAVEAALQKIGQRLSRKLESVRHVVFDSARAPISLPTLSVPAGMPT